MYGNWNRRPDIKVYQNLLQQNDVLKLIAKFQFNNFRKQNSNFMTCSCTQDIWWRIVYMLCLIAARIIKSVYTYVKFKSLIIYTHTQKHKVFLHPLIYMKEMKFSIKARKFYNAKRCFLSKLICFFKLFSFLKDFHSLGNQYFV